MQQNAGYTAVLVHDYQKKNACMSHEIIYLKLETHAVRHVVCHGHRLLAAGKCRVVGSPHQLHRREACVWGRARVTIAANAYESKRYKINLHEAQLP